MTEGHVVIGYVIIVNFLLIVGSAILALFFLYGGERRLFWPMAAERALVLLITLYSIFADQVWRSSEQWGFLLVPPWRPAIFRTPLAIGTWLVIITFWRWRRVNGYKEGR